MFSNRETVLGTETLVTFGTLVRTLSGVNAHMCHQTVSCVERAWTDAARMWALTGMLHHVLLQIAAMLESPATDRAHLGFFPSVDTLMHMQCTWAVKYACTSRALVTHLARRSCSLLGRYMFTCCLCVTTEKTRLWMLRLNTIIYSTLAFLKVA